MVVAHGGRSSHGGQRIAVSAWRSAGSRSSIHLKKYVSHQRSSRGDETSQAVGISGNIHNATTTIHRDPVEKALRDGRWDGMCDGEQEPHVCMFKRRYCTGVNRKDTEKCLYTVCEEIY